MATISKFPGRRQEADNMDYKQKIHLHKLKNTVAVLVCVALFLVVIVSLIIYYQNQTYTMINVINSVERISVDTNKYINHDGKLIVYSKDGVSCIDGKGVSVWNMTYEMQNPIVACGGGYVGVADYNGHVIHIVDSTGKVNEVDTKVPIRDISVSKEGLVAAILEDTTNSWVNLYSVAGERIVEIKATMSKTGYPMSVSLAGDVVGVAYLYVDSENMRSNVTFYNFGGVGENFPDRIVSTFDYTEFIPYVNFIDSEHILSAGENRLNFYEGSTKPVDTHDELINEKIVGLYEGATKTGVLFYDQSGEYKYRLDIYDAKGHKMGSHRFTMDFKDIVFNKDMALIYNENQCILMDLSGNVKFEGGFDEPVNFIASTESSRKYLFVRGESFDTVRFE